MYTYVCMYTCIHTPTKWQVLSVAGDLDSRVMYTRGRGTSKDQIIVLRWGFLGWHQVQKRHETAFWNLTHSPFPSFFFFLLPFPTFSPCFPFPMTGVCPPTSFPFLLPLSNDTLITKPFPGENFHLARKARGCPLKNLPRIRLDAFGRNKTWFTRGLCNFSSPRHYHRWIGLTSTRSAAGGQYKNQLALLLVGSMMYLSSAREPG